MNNHPIHRIKPETINAAEQLHADTVDRLNRLIDACRRDIEQRPAAMGRPSESDDSLHACSLAMGIMRVMPMDDIRMLFATAIYRLARLPAPSDPLEELLKGEHRGQ